MYLPKIVLLKAEFRQDPFSGKGSFSRFLCWERTGKHRDREAQRERVRVGCASGTESIKLGRMDTGSDLG